MLNRKVNKSLNGHLKHRQPNRERPAAKVRPVRRRFIISSKSASPSNSHGSHGSHPAHAPVKPDVIRKKDRKTAAGQQKASGPAEQANATFVSQSSVDLTETIKTLLHLAQENGYVTYDDINDILPDNLSPDDLDELYTKLRTLEVEIVDQAEVERAKPAPQEEDEDARLEILDDPVRMYMNQMGKVPLLTREQEVEICKKIEDAELEMKRIVYSLGFAAKEHIAIAQKLLSEPP